MLSTLDILNILKIWTEESRYDELQREMKYLSLYGELVESKIEKILEVYTHILNVV